MARLLRVPVYGLVSGKLVLSPEMSRYVVRVHRKKVNDEIVVFDPALGLVATAKIIEARLPSVCVDVGVPYAAESQQMPLTLLACVGKLDKPEQAVRDATALGAERLILVQSDRSVARSESTARKERLRRIAEQVARQCQRGELPQILGPLSFEEALAICNHEGLAHEAKAELRLVCAFDEVAKPMLDCLSSLNWKQCHVMVLVGPEGGFSEGELAAAYEHEFRAVDLGPLVLRAETACALVLGVCQSAWWQATRRAIDSE